MTNKKGINKNCVNCEGLCCKNFALEIDTPENERDFEDIKWYLFHENVEVYIDSDGTWNVQFNSRCKYLDENNLCKIYKNRPAMCREFSSEECDLDDDVVCFETVKEFEGWLKKNKKKFLKKVN